MNSRIFSRLVLASVMLCAWSPIMANPSIDEEPDFYSMPGLNTQRSYEATDNLVVDTFSGTLQTHSVDLLLKGTGPDIVVQRAYNSVPSVLSEYSYMGPGWDIHFGRMVGQYTCVNGTYTQNTLKLFFIRPDGGQVQIHGGNTLFLDGNNNGTYESAYDYRPERTTSDFWRAECRGNQLVVSDTQGTHYYLGASDSVDTFARYVVVKVEDAYGESIAIEYELANAFSRPTRVSSADGREVLFGYTGFKLTSVTDGGITINYVYTNNHLTSVEFPEAFIWQYGYKDNTRLLSEVTTPLGTVISVGWDNYFFQNKDYPVVNSKCINTDDCWTYSYQREYNNGSVTQDITTITTPYATREQYYHVTPLSVGNGEIWKIGLLTKKEVYKESTGSIDPNDIDPCSVEGGAFNADIPINTVLYQWESISYSSEQRVYTNSGVSLIDQEYKKPLLQYSEETRNNSTYRYEVLSRYPHGAPEIIKEWGNITRYTKKGYFSDGEALGSWFIALPAVTYISDHDGDYQYVSGVEYNEFGRVERKVEQGTQTVLDYDTEGNLASVTDGENNTTYYSDYHRGIPRRVDYPDFTYETRTVDDRGRITSETNQMFITTSYQYDDLDRVTFIDLPLSQDVDVFYSTDGEYKRFTRGSLQETYRYNTLGNMIRHTREDLTSGQQFVREFEYDVRGQLTFESMVNEPTNGTYYKYDRLGALVKVRTTNGEVVVHDFNNYLQTTTDAMCNTTVNSLDAVSASDQYLRQITGPEGLQIDISRNVMGQPLTIRQNGIVREFTYYPTTWQLKSYKDPEEEGDRSYGYNNAGQIQWMTAGVPSSTSYYSTQYYYDAMGRLKSQAYSTLYVADQYPWDMFPPESCGTVGTGMSCYYKSTQDTYTLDYDDVGNLISKVKTTTHTSWGVIDLYPTFHESSTSWTYTYDDENRMKSEELISALGSLYRLSYDYDNYGYLSSVTYPLGNAVGYAPDVFGRPTQAGSIVSNVQYYDSGAIQALTYGNGMVVNYTLNPRKLTETLQASIAGNTLANLYYEYDLNRNVDLIQDNLFSSKTRSMGYDGLNRMTSANGLWGSGVYDYDSMSNIESKTIAGQSYLYQYDPANNRLTGFNGNSIQYDIYGRITHDGNNQYFYNFSNNLVKAVNLTSGTNVGYRYDANNRLESSGQNYGERYVYSAAGKLMYEVQRDGDLKRSHVYLGTRLVGYQDQSIDCADDLDNDGMGHCYERENNLNVNTNDANGDRDQDGILNIDEYNLGLLAGNADSDGDGMDDLSEITYGLDPLVDDAAGDADGDGFTNLEEIQQGSDPQTQTDLSSASNFAANFGTESVVVSWYPVMHADGYDLYWSNVPFTDLASANLIENVTSPYADSVGAGETVRYYRLVTKKGELRSAPTAQKRADLVAKEWVYAGLLENVPQAIEMDGAGNVHILKSSASTTGEVAFWDSETQTLLNYDLFSFSPTYLRLAVAANGEAMLLTFNYNDRAIWTARFNPATKSWTTEKIGFVEYGTQRVYNPGIVASDNGHFAITWEEEKSSGVNDLRWARAYSPDTGWGPAILASYTQESSPYYALPPTYYHRLEVNNQGDMAMAWMLRDSAASVTQVHLLTLANGGEPTFHYVSNLNGSGYLNIELNDQGTGVLTWKIDFSGQTYSQRFDLQQLQGPVRSLGLSNPGVMGLALIDDTATAFVKQDSVVQIITQQGDSDWSAPVVSALSGSPDSDHLDAYPTQDSGIYATGYGKTFRFLDGTITQVASPPLGLTHWESSGINRAGDFAVVVSLAEPNQYPLFIYRSTDRGDNVLPIAIAGSDIEVTDEIYANLSAALSTDTDGLIISHNWTQISGPTVNVVSPSKKDTVVYMPNLSQGEFEFQLTVTDDRGGQATDTVRVTLDNPYGPPTADAGADQAVDERTTVQLSAANSTSAELNPIVSYFWEQMDGPQVTLTDATSVNASFVAPEVDGTTELQFQVTVTTGEDYPYSTTDVVIITVRNNELPIASFGEDQTVNIGDRVVLDYSGSTDPDGGSYSLSFSIIAGGAVQLESGAAPQTLEFTAPQVSVDTVYTFRVTITDDEGDTAYDDVSVTVLAPVAVAYPVANAGIDQTVNANQAVTLDGTSSTAPSGYTLTQYQWAQLSGTAVTLSDTSSATPGFTAPDVASDTNLVFQLQITASNGETATDTVTISVLATTGNLPPVADAGPDQTVNEGDTVILDARGSSDPDGLSLSLSWSLISGAGVSLQQGPEPGTLQFVAPSVAFDADLVFEVTVTDSNGASSTDQVTITVLNTDTPPPAGECELDFDGNGIVEEKDFYSTNYEGIYYAVYIYLNYNAYYSNYFPNTPVEKLDWNGDGSITIEEVYTGTISPATLDTFQTQHWYYLNNPAAYATYYPDSGCAL